MQPNCNAFGTTECVEQRVVMFDSVAAVSVITQALEHRPLPRETWSLGCGLEPVAGVIGAVLVVRSAAFLPYGMAAAGAMLYVVVEELIPETVRSGTLDVATPGFIGGFTVMMAPDNALG